MLVGGLLLGSAGTAGALAPDEATPAAIGGLRVTIGSLVLTAVLPLVGGSVARMTRLTTHWQVWAMAACTAAFQPLFFGAVARTGVALATLLAIGGIPVIAGLIAWPTLRLRPTRTWGVATAIAVLGLVVRSWSELRAGDGLGVLMAAAAATVVGCYVVTTKARLDTGAQPVELAAAAYLLAAVLSIPMMAGQPLGWLRTSSGLAVAVYLGVATMALGNVVTVRGIRGLSPGPAATLMLADPVTATLLGVLVLHERLDFAGVVGLVLVLTGLAVQAVAPSYRARAVDPGPDRAGAPVPAGVVFTRPPRSDADRG